LARTAAIAGTATAVSNRVSRRQGNRWAQQEYDDQQQQQQQYAPPPPPPPAAEAAPDPYAKIKELAALHEQGILTDQEFADAKAKVLG